MKRRKKYTTGKGLASVVELKWLANGTDLAPSLEYTRIRSEHLP